MAVVMFVTDDPTAAAEATRVASLARQDSIRVDEAMASARRSPCPRGYLQLPLAPITPALIHRADQRGDPTDRRRS